MIDKWVRPALLAGVFVLASSSAGCTLVADPEQKQTVRENMDALPEDVVKALRAGDVRMHFSGEVGKNVSADRQVRLPTAPSTVTPPTATTTAGRWVAGCRAAVAALAGSSGRLYGRLPEGAGVYEATDELCRRGLGHPLGSSDDPTLRIGLPQPDGRVRDTAVTLDATKSVIETSGSGGPVRGAPIDASQANPAELDKAIISASLPWRYLSRTETPSPAPSTGQNNRLGTRVAFVVPAGTRLRIGADCGERAPDRHAQADPRADATYLTFGGGAPAAFPNQRSEMVACGERLARPLEPQLSYRTATGGWVDRYQLVVMPNPAVSRTDPPPVRQVLVETLP